MQPQVLVVDDQLTVVRSWEAVLSETGIEVTGTRDGREAWEKFQKARFDAVITDIKMPGMDGMELLKKIKESGKEAEVVVFTGYGSQDHVDRAKDLGVYEFILKPVSPTTMTDVALRALARRGFSKDQFTPRWQWLVRPPDVAARMKAEAEKMAPMPEAARITQEHFEKIDALAARYRHMPGGLIPTLQKVQNLVGYLPPLVQKRIAVRLDVPVSEVFSVVTFYSFFTMVPRGKHVCRVCLGTACYVLGGKEIASKLCQNFNVELGQTTDDMLYTIEAVRCLGACGLAPAMTVDGRVYGRNDPGRVVSVLETYT
jgi:NADH:ubiquinone oxidoreductase subunit E/ActR/RegA family two-component response regulator